MDANDIIRQTQEMIARKNAENQKYVPQQADAMETRTPSGAMQFMPSVPDGAFLIEVASDDERAIFCVRELLWHEQQDIECLSFRNNDKDEPYFAGEYERRETLRKAILWVFDPETGHTKYNDRAGTILKTLSHEIVELAWPQYLGTVALNSEEANALYQAAQKYFRGDAQAGHPVPSLVTEMDYIAKGMVTLSRDELRAITASDMERMQLILTARADSLGFATPTKEAAASSGNSYDDDLSPELIDTLPPHIKEKMFGR